MNVQTDFIEAHQFPFPEQGDPISVTPFTIKFAPEMTNLELFLEDVFDGGDPFYFPGMCRPITAAHDTFSVGAVAAPLPDADADDPPDYSVHYPSNQMVWFDVTPEEMDVYVRDTVDPQRVEAFCATLGERYGVELQEVTGLPAVPREEESSL